MLTLMNNKWNNLNDLIRKFVGSLSNQEIHADINNVQVEVSDNEDDESVEGRSVTKPRIEETSSSSSWEY